MTDVLGYQSQGASSSDSAIAKVVTNKLPLLNSPGHLIPNSLYYDADNCSVQAAEMTNYFGRDRINFNSASTSGTPTIHIPSVLFTNTCFALFELQNVSWSGGDKETGRFYMPPAWGYQNIRTITYYLGASSVANVDISGETNFFFALASCETIEKKMMVVSKGGYCMVATKQNASYSQQGAGLVALADPDVPAGSSQSVFSIKGDGHAGGTVAQRDYLRQAIVHIRLPFSSMAALEKRLSFDTHLLTQPIQVTLTLKGLTEIGAILTTETSNTMLTSFAGSTFQAFQQELSDKSLSLRNELLAAPSFSVGLPFQYLQSMPFQVDTAPQSGTDAYTTNITSLMNADLTTIFIAVSWAGDIKYLGNGYSFKMLEDIELLLNGQVLHRYALDAYQLTQTSLNISTLFPPIASSYGPLASGYSEIANASTCKSFALTKCAIYEINISRLRAIAMESHLMNTPRYTNQTFQLRFRVPRNWPNYPADWTDAMSPSFGSLNMHIAYSYNGCFLVGGDGGQSKLMTA